MTDDCFKVFRNIYSLLFYGVYTILYVTATTAAQWLLLFVVGSIVVVKNISANCQAFLQGHTGDVTCLAVSHDGTMLATGQQSEEGARADVLVWDLEVNEPRRRLCSPHPHSSCLPPRVASGLATT